jgi:hypothetical protein
MNTNGADKVTWNVNPEVRHVRKRYMTDEEKAARRKEFETLDHRASESKEALFNDGVQAGTNAAADDFLAGKVNLDLFSRGKILEDLDDGYSLGFELGYMRKLAEINLN